MIRIAVPLLPSFETTNSARPILEATPSAETAAENVRGAILSGDFSKAKASLSDALEPDAFLAPLSEISDEGSVSTDLEFVAGYGFRTILESDAGCFNLLLMMAEKDDMRPYVYSYELRALDDAEDCGS
jgi:hypothetical protein